LVCRNKTNHLFNKTDYSAKILSAGPYSACGHGVIFGESLGFKRLMMGKCPCLLSMCFGEKTLFERVGGGAFSLP